MLELVNLPVEVLGNKTSAGGGFVNESTEQNCRSACWRGNQEATQEEADMKIVNNMLHIAERTKSFITEIIT